MASRPKNTNNPSGRSEVLLQITMEMEASRWKEVWGRQVVAMETQHTFSMTTSQKVKPFSGFSQPIEPLQNLDGKQQMGLDTKDTDEWSQDDGELFCPLLLYNNITSTTNTVATQFHLLIKMRLGLF